MGSQVRGVGAVKHELKNPLEKLDEGFDYAVEANIASKSYPDLVGAYWKGSLTPKATSSNTPQTSKIIATEALAYTTFKNSKMVETWYVVDGLESRMQEKRGEV